jgi:hypothetical protein
MSNLRDASLGELLNQFHKAARSSIDPAVREYFIHGVTAQGKVFRPSDWAERLCGVMACYRPAGSAGRREPHLGYSPYVRPLTIGGVKCVVLDERLKEIEPMAFHFVLGFARDNDLPVYEGCSLA